MNLPKAFQEYLLTRRGISKRTLRYYRSDLKHFFGWASFHLTAQGISISDWESVFPHLTSQVIGQYKGYHLENKIADATLNRRLSALRSLTKFFTQTGLLSQDPTKFIENVTRAGGVTTEEVLSDFARELRREGVSQVTLKNYLSDVRQFLGWSSRAGGSTPP